MPKMANLENLFNILYFWSNSVTRQAKNRTKIDGKISKFKNETTKIKNKYVTFVVNFQTMCRILCMLLNGSFKNLPNYFIIRLWSLLREETKRRAKVSDQVSTMMH